MIRGALLLAIALTPVGPVLAQPLLSPQEQSSADMDARMVKARYIVEQTMPAAQRDQMFSQMLDGFMANMLSGMMQGDPKLKSLLDSNAEAAEIFANFIDRQKKLALDDFRTTGPEMIEALASAYSKRFSLAELSDIEVFASTPTGARFLQAGRQVFADPAIAEWQRRSVARSQARAAIELHRLKDELTPILEKQNAQPHP
jgi:hypothetical protein